MLSHPVLEVPREYDPVVLAVTCRTIEYKPVEVDALILINPPPYEAVGLPKVTELLFIVEEQLGAVVVLCVVLFVLLVVDDLVQANKPTIKTVTIENRKSFLINDIVTFIIQGVD